MAVSQRVGSLHSLFIQPQKRRQLLAEGGQSIAEYALVLGFVALPALYWSEHIAQMLVQMFHRVVVELSVYVNVL